MGTELFFQVIISLLIIGATIMFIYYYRKNEHNALLQKRANYYHALHVLSDNPENPYIKEECQKLGDEYYRDIIPDIYSYPLPNYGLYVESIDNSQKRQEMINKDIESVTSNHQMAA